MAVCINIAEEDGEAVSEIANAIAQNIPPGMQVRHVLAAFTLLLDNAITQTTGEDREDNIKALRNVVNAEVFGREVH